MPSIKDKDKENETKEEVETPVEENTDDGTEALSGNQFVTKEEMKDFGDNLFTKISGLFRKETDVHQDNLAAGSPIPNQELGKDMRGVEPVSANDFVDQADIESFMNNMVTIYVHPSPNKEDNPVIVPNVNGINQPIIRGQVCKVKRKYVEALARNRHTRYEQKMPDPNKPHQYVMDPDIVVKDPFTVRHDPHPNGHEWLQAILSER